MRLAFFVAVFSAALASGASVTGRVVDDATGTPLTKAEVRIFGKRLPPLTIKSGDDGTFQAGDLAPGDYTATAWHPGYLYTEVSAWRLPIAKDTSGSITFRRAAIGWDWAIKT